MPETPATPPYANYDGVMQQLIFLANFFGKAVDEALLRADTPIVDNRISERQIHECAARGGLRLTKGKRLLTEVKASELPALLIAPDESPLVLLGRDGEHWECVQANIEGSRRLTLAEIQRDYPGQLYFVRPLLYFDTRSLLYNLPRPRRWFWDALLANRAMYGWALLATVMINLFGAVIPFYTMAVYDRVIPNNALDSLWVLTSAVAVILLFDIVIKMLRSYLLECAARKADIGMSSHVFAHTLRLRAASRPASGGVLANIVRDFEAVREFAASSTLTLLGDAPFMFLFLILIAIISHWLVLVPLLLIPLIIASAFFIRRQLARLLVGNMRDSAQRTAHLFEVMNGLDTVKLQGAEAWARRQWESLTVRISENTVALREWTSLGTQFSMMLGSFCSILIVMFGALLIADAALSMGQLIAASMLASRAIAPATQIAALIVRYEQTRQALDALDKIMAAPVDEASDSLHLARLNGQIDFRDVHFAYPNTPPLLKGLNLAIKPGERVGFIGRIGSGKSTLYRLILNLYEAQQGRVLIDGIAAAQIEPQSLRRQVGYVPQDITLFHGSIRDNILLGNSAVSDADLLDAVRIAGLEDSLAQLPQGLGTEVGERGERLSGGQRQAIAIARALAGKPRMLLLDEPSSMMDPGTEQRLIENLRGIEGQTILLVTHRMAMLPLVDRLVVLDQGKVALDGPRNEVLRALQSKQAASAPEKEGVSI